MLVDQTVSDHGGSARQRSLKPERATDQIAKNCGHYPIDSGPADLGRKLH